jgi:hypothetical protein
MALPNFRLQTLVLPLDHQIQRLAARLSTEAAGFGNPTGAGKYYD